MSAEIETLHKPFIRWLKQERLPYIRARSDRPSTIGVGVHDFTVFYGNRSLCIEFKDAAPLTKKQVQWITDMKAVGSTVHVIRDIGVACALVNEWRSTIAPVMPTAQEVLFRFKNGVFRHGPRGAERVRLATGADMGLPTL